MCIIPGTKTKKVEVGHTTRMRVATNRAGILLAIMHPGYQDTTTYAALKRSIKARNGIANLCKEEIKLLYQ